jgi:hypothetical protein
MVYRVAVRTTYVVTEVLATTIVVMLFLAGMASKAAFGSLFGCLVFERDDLSDVAATFNVCLTRAVTRLAACDLPLP